MSATPAPISTRSRCASSRPRWTAARTASAIGGKWLHLRICLTCGHVGCCDNSPNRHATAHHHATSHPIIRSLEPGEDWSWCYVDEVALVIDGVSGETRIPPSPLGQWPGLPTPVIACAAACASR